MSTGEKQAFPPNGAGLGMTLREHYACEAMKSLVTNYHNFSGSLDTEDIAKLAVAQADDLIKALDKTV